MADHKKLSIDRRLIKVYKPVKKYGLLIPLNGLTYCKPLSSSNLFVYNVNCFINGTIGRPQYLRGNLFRTKHKVILVIAYYWVNIVLFCYCSYIYLLRICQYYVSGVQCDNIVRMCDFNVNGPAFTGTNTYTQLEMDDFKNAEEMVNISCH